MLSASVYDPQTETIRCRSCGYAIPIPRGLRSNALKLLIFQERFENKHAEVGHRMRMEKPERVRLISRIGFNPSSFDFARAVRAAQR